MQRYVLARVFWLFANVGQLFVYRDCKRKWLAARRYPEKFPGPHPEKFPGIGYVALADVEDVMFGPVGSSH